jgi:5-methyltetrahydropteroyltriglutamate--homocysteine methyltransferase
MIRAVPPFRADHVGSLLRPAVLKAAREHFAKGTLPRAELTAIEDREIARVIRKHAKYGRRRTPITVEGGHSHGDCGHLKMAA